MQAYASSRQHAEHIKIILLLWEKNERTKIRLQKRIVKELRTPLFLHMAACFHLHLGNVKVKP